MWILFVFVYHFLEPILISIEAEHNGEESYLVTLAKAASIVY